MTGRTFLLTGVTGFLGKVVLEELLRRREELGVERIYAVIRPRDELSAEDRFQCELIGSPCFSRLPDDWSRLVTVIGGVLEQPEMGLGAIRGELAARVTHVIHAAASVEFDLPVAEAARANIATNLNVLELARSCPRLERLVSVSTAYATPHPGDAVPIQETPAPLWDDPERIYRDILDGRAAEADLLARSGHPNTYTLTKSLAEHLVIARRGEVPLSIVRPSIISASRRYPFPGWIDSTSGFAAFVVLLGLGHLRAVLGRPGARLDLVPVDEVAGRLLDEAVAESRGEGPAIRQAVAGLARSATVRECWNIVQEFFRTHRIDRLPVRRYLGRSAVGFATAHAIWHRLPIALGTLRSRDSRRRGRQLVGRLAYLNRVFPYFTSNSFDFRSSVPLDGDFEPTPYVRTVARGIYRHVLKRDETEWPLAGRRHPGNGGDLRWSLGQPNGNAWIRFASWVVTKVLRKAVDRVTVDLPSFEAARRSVPEGAALVIVPNHRSYLDFVLCSYLAFARPDLGIAIPHIAATIEFGRIPVLGRILRSLHAFYLRRGEGKEDPELTHRVHELVAAGRTLEFFIEGQRSRSREFLPPKRGLLRCLQATGKTCVLLPVALSYDRVPEEKAFARELAGGSKPKMRLGPLVKWTYRVWRGRIDLGRIHLACGVPVRLDGTRDVHEVSQEVIASLRGAMVATTYHLDAFLDCCAGCGVDRAWLHRAIEQRGGRVLQSALRPADDLDPLIAATLRHQFAHHFEGDGVTDESSRTLRTVLFGPRQERSGSRRPVSVA